MGNTAERIVDVRKYLILVHTFGECITTSAVYEHGKLPVSKLLEKFTAATEVANVFFQKNRTAETNYETGVKIFVMLHFGKDRDLLTDLRNLKYISMTSSSRNMKHESLLSTECVTMFHAYQVYFQY